MIPPNLPRQHRRRRRDKIRPRRASGSAPALCLVVHRHEDAKITSPGKTPRQSLTTDSIDISRGDLRPPPMLESCAALSSFWCAADNR
ncbi:hypothetical protein OH77DRAFT_1425563 [Trametes cingulata]|nr:hypothetical protein OH77DRAFT_1425563 [Trametes cingulata]